MEANIWHTISSVPKDGTVIDLCDFYSGILNNYYWDKEKQFFVPTTYGPSVVREDSVSHYRISEKPLFAISICCHNNPAIEINNASKKLHSFLRSVVCNNWINDEEYKVSKASGAFLQGGSNLEEGWLLIEFWRPEGISQFVEFITRKWKELNNVHSKILS